MLLLTVPFLSMRLASFPILFCRATFLRGLVLDLFIPRLGSLGVYVKQGRVVLDFALSSSLHFLTLYLNLAVFDCCGPRGTFCFAVLSEGMSIGDWRCSLLLCFLGWTQNNGNSTGWEYTVLARLHE